MLSCSSNSGNKIVTGIILGGDAKVYLFLVKATTTPALPENFLLAHLMKTDIQLETEIKPRYTYIYNI